MSKNYKDYERREMDNLKGNNQGNQGNQGNQNINELVNFRHFVLEPRNVDNANQLLPEDQYFVAATITFPRLRNGDVVWLNGVLGLENTAGGQGADVKISIFKGSPPVLIAGQEIYKSDFDIEQIADDETVAPLSHVDVISGGNQQDVQYTLAIKAEDPGLFLNGPVTFTGLQLRS